VILRRCLPEARPHTGCVLLRRNRGWLRA
jgi:hypothetical protein